MLFPRRGLRVIIASRLWITTSAPRKLRQMTDNGDLGSILYFDLVRVNFGLFQKNVNAIWNLAPHDLLT